MSVVDVVRPASAPPTAGKREATKLANRQAILDAAREVFAELGYDAASVRDIIRKTGLSVGAFYNYYRSKEEVFDALAEDGARRFRPRLEALHHTAADLETYLRGSLEAYFTFLAEQYERLRHEGPAETFPHARTDTPEIAAVFAEVRQGLEDVMRRQGAETGGLDLDYLTASCIGLAREVADEMLKRRPLDVGAAVDFAFTFIRGGFESLAARAMLTAKAQGTRR